MEWQILFDSTLYEVQLVLYTLYTFPELDLVVQCFNSNRRTIAENDIHETIFISISFDFSFQIWKIIKNWSSIYTLSWFVLFSLYTCYLYIYICICILCIIFVFFIARRSDNSIYFHEIVLFITSTIVIFCVFFLLVYY